MQIVPRKGHYLGVLTNRDKPAKDVATIEVNKADKSSLIGGFVELFQLMQTSPSIEERSIATADPMMIVEVLAEDPELEVELARCRDLIANPTKDGEHVIAYSVERAQEVIDEHERVGIRIGSRYAVTQVRKVGTAEDGRPLVLFTAHEAVAKIGSSGRCNRGS